MAKRDYSEEELIEFEERIAQKFNQGEIRAPIHLSNGNELDLINIFRSISNSDWVFGSWRSHYQCLLKGVPQSELERAILDGKSIALCFPELKVFSSAIVGGSLPIALGVAIASKRLSLGNHVWCFMGDMTSETGIAHSCVKYAQNNSLPITFVIEDNGLSVCTPTNEIWNSDGLSMISANYKNVIFYKYVNKYPHAGAGKRVQF